MINISSRIRSGAEKTVINVLNAAQLSNPNYQPIETWNDLGEPSTDETYKISNEKGSSDIQFLGRGTVAVGAGLIAIGGAMEIVGLDDLDTMTVMTGVGGIAVGALVTLYNRI